MDATPTRTGRTGHHLNTRLRLACLVALAALTGLATIALAELPATAFVLAATWAGVHALEYEWMARRLRDGHAYGTTHVVVSHVVDIVCCTAFVWLTGSGLWITSLGYLFIIASVHAAFQPRLAATLSGAVILAFVALLAAQVQGVVGASPLFGFGRIAQEPQIAAATGVVFAIFTCMMALVMTGIVQELRGRTAQHRAVLDTASDIILVLAPDGRVRQRNRAADAAVASHGGTFEHDALGALLLADDVPLALETLATATTGAPRSVLLRARGSAAGVRWYSATFAPMQRTVPGASGHVLAILRDVTDERRGADAVRHSEARLRAVFDQAAVAIALTDLSGAFVEANTAIERVLGHRADELLGRPWLHFVPHDDHAAAREALDAIAAGEHESATIEQRFVRRDGRVVWAQLTVSRAEAPDDRGGLVVMLQDITERRALEAQLTWQAYHDPLTNLANRTLFRDRVERALLARRDRPGSVGVLFLDLDNFKHVNDSLGHAAGDQLLFEVARRLLNATRGCDTVARLGGDEFAILLDNIRNAADCTIVAERVLTSMQTAVLLEGREVTVGASIGIVRADEQASADELLRDADVAMYDAKQAGKNRHAIFEPRMHVQAVARMQLEADLRVAIESGEFSLVFQPIVRLESGRPTHFEALVRWVHPSLGPVGPDVFVPLAEETGLIVPLGRWILGEACRSAVRWQQLFGGVERIGIAVNVSPRQLEEPGLVQQVREVLEETGLSPSLLTLEITETGLVGETGAMPDRLRELKALGVALAIDDFGTGYSSLGYIQRFPVDVLKIDKVFVDGLRRAGGHEAALARTIIGLGQSLGLKTVAEGIETDAQRAILAELGCQHGQGYLFSRPLPNDDVVPWLARALELPLPSYGAPVRPRPRRRTITGPMASVG